MKNFIAKLASVLKTVFGYGIMLSLFAGGLTFFGYLAALIIGGDVAVTICEVIYKTIFPIIIKISTVMVLLGLVTMYLSGEKALVADKKESHKHEGEM